MNWQKKVVLFISGQTVTIFGSMLVQYAISWHITLETKNGMMITLATLCGFLPQVLISLFSGVWADRYNRKKLIIAADATIAVCTAFLAIAFTLGYREIWLLFFISAVRSLGAGVQQPAVGAFITELAPQEKMMRINSVNQTIQSIMMLVCPAAAGGLYELMGLQSVFWVDVITAIIGIAFLVVLKVLPRDTSHLERQHIFKDMSIGLRYVFFTKWLRQFLGFYLFYALMFGPVVFMTPLLVARSFGDESWRLVVHEIVFAAGSTIGGVVVGIIATKMKNAVKLLIGSCIIFGLTTLLMGFSPSFTVYLCIMFPMGLVMPGINIGSMTVLQTKVKPELIGRVFSLSSIIGSAAMPMSMIVFGPLADKISVETELIISGIIMVAISLLTLFFKEMIQIGETSPKENEINIES